jgi:hypothetical protein
VEIVRGASEHNHTPETVPGFGSHVEEMRLGELTNNDISACFF